MFGFDAWVAAIIIMVLFVAAVLACVYLVWRVGGTASKHNSDLVSCPNCRRQISREYATCPECGHVMASALVLVLVYVPSGMTSPVHSGLRASSAVPVVVSRVDGAFDPAALEPVLSPQPASRTAAAAIAVAVRTIFMISS